MCLQAFMGDPHIGHSVIFSLYPAYRALGHLLLVPLAAADALIVPLVHLLDALHAHRPESYAHNAGHVLYGVVVREDGPADIEGKGQDGHVHRRQPSEVAAPACRGLHLLQRFLGAVRHPDHVAPERQAGVLVLLQFPDHAGRAHVLLIGEGIHGEESGAVQDQHAAS